jgi:hypothetical protein
MGALIVVPIVALAVLPIVCNSPVRRIVQVSEWKDYLKYAL